MVVLIIELGEIRRLIAPLIATFSEKPLCFRTFHHEGVLTLGLVLIIELGEIRRLIAPLTATFIYK